MNSPSEYEEEAAYQAAQKAGGPPLMPRDGRFKPPSVWLNAIALLLGVSVVTAVFYPVWAGQNRPRHSRGVVQDENRLPIVGAVVRVRDADRRDLATLTTDANGTFLWRKAWAEPGVTFGDYGVARFSRNTGMPAYFYLFPLALHEVRVRNAVTGLPLENLPLDGLTTYNTFNFRGGGRRVSCQTDAKGYTNLGVFPVTVRMDFRSTDRTFVVWNVVPTVSTNYKISPPKTTVRYEVTVVPTGAVTGRAVYANGTPARGGKVFVRLQSSNPELNTTTQSIGSGASGIFLIRGLRPGRYRLQYDTNGQYSDGFAKKQEVLVESGKTTTLAAPLHVIGVP